jgi:hypothetical protein
MLAINKSNIRKLFCEKRFASSVFKQPFHGIICDTDIKSFLIAKKYIYVPHSCLLNTNRACTELAEVACTELAEVACTELAEVRRGWDSSTVNFLTEISVEPALAALTLPFGKFAHRSELRIPSQTKQLVCSLSFAHFIRCGGGGIRTHEAISDLRLLQSRALDHYATPPAIIFCIIEASV